MCKCEMEVISLHTGLYANPALAGSRTMPKIRRPPIGAAVLNVPLKRKSFYPLHRTYRQEQFL
jgi:hypothetical protein